MKNILLLLHGFKKNGVDDFEKVTSFFNENLKDYEILNEEWFDNYNLATMKRKYFLKRVNEISDLINVEKPDKLIIVAFSTGSIIASLIVKKIKISNVSIFSIVPPIKINFSKWLPIAWKQFKSNKKLKKKLGKKRFKRIKEKQQENKKIEKYPIRIINFINLVRLRYRKKILKHNFKILFLFSENDTFVKTAAILKKIDKNKYDITVKKFDHDQILKKNNSIFIEWFEEKYKILYNQ